MSAEVTLTEDEREALARIIWTTSRADEGTISATGANHVADAILASDWLAARVEQAEQALARVGTLADEWRYKGEFGWDDGSHAYGPDPEGYILDSAAVQLRAALRGPS